MASIGLIVAFALLSLVPRQVDNVPTATEAGAGEKSGRGFKLLLAIGAFNTATRMGYLLFLPFLFHAKGGSEATVGVGLALLFAGDALGKACCGRLGQRLGVTWSVIVTEAATVLLIAATLLLPLEPMLVLLPLLGIVLNGTSSVLYGTVPDMAREGEVGRAFALLYTAVIGAGGLAPIAYAVIADHSSRTSGVVAAVLTAAAIIPMVIAMRPFLREERAR